MSVTKEFIMMAAGLIITVSLIFIGFGVYKKAAAAGMLLAEREEKRINEIADYELHRYDDIPVNGSKVLRYIKQIGMEYDVEITVTVANPTLCTYRMSETGSFSELRNAASEKYINPLKLYSVTVQEDENAALCSIEIKQMED